MTRQPLRRALGALVLAIMGASAIYGGGFFGIRDRFAPPATRTDASPFQAIDESETFRARDSYRRSQPYWRPLERFQGSGPTTTRPFEIDSRALQWRVKWRCQNGQFRIQPQRPSGNDHGHRLADTEACPKQETGLSVASGDFKLDVQAQGPWTAEVEQQVDVPLVEPPPREVASRRSRPTATGRFYGIDEDGEGSVKIYRLGDGSAIVRLEDFYVTPNLDLEIRFSELEQPRSTREVAAAPFKDIVFLKATTGAVNYRIPPGALNDRVRSIVIWCEITKNAYAAATLRN